MTHQRKMEGCLFCAIAAGSVPAAIVHEDEAVCAFLDIRPIRPGHVQIVPRVHYPWFDDLPGPLAAGIVHLGQRIAAAHKRLYGVRRSAFLFTGGDIPHAHAHVVPMVSGADITSRRYIAEETLTFRDLPRVPDGELADTAQRLRTAIGG